METTPRINVTLVLFWRFAGNLINSLQLVNWSIFVLRRRETTMVSMTLLYMGWQFEHPAFYAMLNCNGCICRHASAFWWWSARPYRDPIPKILNPAVLKSWVRQWGSLIRAATVDPLTLRLSLGVFLSLVPCPRHRGRWLSRAANGKVMCPGNSSHLSAARRIEATSKWRCMYHCHCRSKNVSDGIHLLRMCKAIRGFFEVIFRTTRPAFSFPSAERSGLCNWSWTSSFRWREINILTALCINFT